MSVCCASCQLPIHDRYVYHVLGKAWHQQCLRCMDCNSPMTETCFSRDGMILCKADFNRRYAAKCAGCDGYLDKEDLVRKTRDRVFHIDCFQCSICFRKLDTGEQLYILSGNRFVCQEDFHRHQLATTPSTAPSTTPSPLITPTVAMVSSALSNTPVTPTSLPQPASVAPSQASSMTPTSGLGQSTSRTGSHGSDDGVSDGEDENVDTVDEIQEGGDNGADGDMDKNDDANGTKRRGPRTTIKAKQLETLKNAFATTPKPTRHIREQLAQETGLNMRVIQVWFQNRRSKERRLKQQRYGTYRPSRRSRGGRDELCQDVYDGAPFFPHPPMGFYCGDIYGAVPGDRPPPGALPPPFPMTPDGSGPPMMAHMSEQFDGHSSPLPQLNGAQMLVAPPEFDDEAFRGLPGIYPPDMKSYLTDMNKHPLPSW